MGERSLRFENTDLRKYLQTYLNLNLWMKPHGKTNNRLLERFAPGINTIAGELVKMCERPEQYPRIRILMDDLNLGLARNILGYDQDYVQTFGHHEIDEVDRKIINLRRSGKTDTMIREEVSNINKLIEMIMELIKKLNRIIVALIDGGKDRSLIAQLEKDFRFYNECLEYFKNVRASYIIEIDTRVSKVNQELETLKNMNESINTSSNSYKPIDIALENVMNAKAEMLTERLKVLQSASNHFKAFSI